MKTLIRLSKLTWTCGAMSSERPNLPPSSCCDKNLVSKNRKYLNRCLIFTMKRTEGQPVWVVKQGMGQNIVVPRNRPLETPRNRLRESGKRSFIFIYLEDTISIHPIQCTSSNVMSSSFNRDLSQIGHLWKHCPGHLSSKRGQPREICWRGDFLTTCRRTLCNFGNLSLDSFCSFEQGRLPGNGFAWFVSSKCSKPQGLDWLSLQKRRRSCNWSASMCSVLSPAPTPPGTSSAEAFPWQLLSSPSPLPRRFRLCQGSSSCWGSWSSPAWGASVCLWAASHPWACQLIPYRFSSKLALGKFPPLHRSE